MGPFGRTVLSDTENQQVSKYFWSFMRQIQQVGKGSLSVPLLTNLALWYQLACSDRVGTCALTKGKAD
jgi:hypothetical protein